MIAGHTDQQIQMYTVDMESISYKKHPALVFCISIDLKTLNFCADCEKNGYPLFLPDKLDVCEP